MFEVWQNTKQKKETEKKSEPVLIRGMKAVYF
jgi:hypothetical protein